ncbi:hypothetical protein [Aquisalimonas sp.]|uniref:hypothetical protein n=1 Tax=Aquisalimonas sp. TaxID=1872621 RepID=UPI0025C5BE83|nr:hypothetical protein [Aquisalimonas sp.]
MRRTLLVAEGTLHRPAVNILTTAIGFSITLLVGFGILHLGLPGWLTLALIAALIMTVAVIKARYGGPRGVRLEKPAVGGTLRVTGRFENGEIPTGAPADLVRISRTAGALVFHVAARDGEAAYQLTPPAFSATALDTLHGLITQMPTLSEADLHQHYKGGRDGIKAYDAKQLLLLRFTEKPGFMPITWAVSGMTLVFWLILLALLLDA